MASPNAFVCFHQRLGFSRTYAFIFYFIGAGALFAFTLARVQYLNIDAFCPPEGRAAGGAGAAPGECFYFAMNRYRIPLILHLATIFPASLLAVVQFLPIIRRKFILYHRVAGYVAVFLALVSMSAAVALTPKSFGGASATQAAIALLSVAFAGALVMPIVNIRRKQIDQHRNWQLRAWSWASSIITLRLLMVISAGIMTRYGPSDAFWMALNCHELRFIMKDDDLLSSLYPTCSPILTSSTPTTIYVAIQASMALRIENLAVALKAGFSLAIWVAWALHALLVEIYIKLTPREAERLRVISWQRQLEAGYSSPGSAGLTCDKLGDSERWIPPVDREKEAINETGPPMLSPASTLVAPQPAYSSSTTKSKSDMPTTP